MKNWSMAAVVALGLGACSSTGDACGPVSGNINGCSNGQVANAIASFAADFTKATYNTNDTPQTTDDTITFVGGDFDGQNNYERDPGNDRSGGGNDFLAFTNQFNGQNITYYAAYGKSTSGDIIVVLNATGDYATEGDYFAGYERLTSSAIPTAGNANYTGDYAGAIVNTDQSGITLSEGTMTMSVEFDENSRAIGLITITDTTVISGDAPEDTAVSIVLNESTMDGRTGKLMDGTVTAFDGSGEEIGDGTYVGVVGGNNGSEIGGAIEVTYGDNREFGIFVGECVPTTPTNNLTCDP